jgi:hypothetical protein
MAYDTANPPFLISQGIGGVGQVWGYRSTDAGTTVDAAGYFTNGADLGMATGGAIVVVDTDASPVAAQVAFINVVGGTPDITDATAATDSD